MFVGMAVMARVLKSAPDVWVIDWINFVFNPFTGFRIGEFTFKLITWVYDGDGYNVWDRLIPITEMASCVTLRATFGNGDVDWI